LEDEDPDAYVPSSDEKPMSRRKSVNTRRGQVASTANSVQSYQLTSSEDGKPLRRPLSSDENEGTEGSSDQPQQRKKRRTIRITRKTTSTNLNESDENVPSNQEMSQTTTNRKSRRKSTGTSRKSTTFSTSSDENEETVSPALNRKGCISHRPKQQGAISSSALEKFRRSSTKRRSRHNNGSEDSEDESDKHLPSSFSDELSPKLSRKTTITTLKASRGRQPSPPKKIKAQEFVPQSKPRQLFDKLSSKREQKKGESRSMEKSSAENLRDALADADSSCGPEDTYQQKQVARTISTNKAPCCQRKRKASANANKAAALKELKELKRIQHANKLLEVKSKNRKVVVDTSSESDFEYGQVDDQHKDYNSSGSEVSPR
jgi:hypothetical protein